MKAPPLIFEELGTELNQVFLTLIEFKRIKYLTIVENVIGDEIHAYVLDQLEAEGVDSEWFMSVAVKWFYSASERYPLSFEFAKLGANDRVNKVIKTFSVNAMSRVIGKLFTYNMQGKPKIKRRKVQHVASLEEVKLGEQAPIHTRELHRLMELDGDLMPEGSLREDEVDDNYPANGGDQLSGEGDNSTSNVIPPILRVHEEQELKRPRNNVTDETKDLKPEPTAGNVNCKVFDET